MPVKGLDDIRAAINAIKSEINDSVKGVYLAGLKNVVMMTPSDKGLARNGWFLTVGKPSKAVPRDANSTGSGSLNRLGKMPGSVLGKKLYFTNNVKYINILEYGGFPVPVKQGSYINGQFQKLSSNGYSKQAPAGMARINIVKMASKIRSL